MKKIIEAGLNKIQELEMDTDFPRNIILSFLSSVLNAMKEAAEKSSDNLMNINTRIAGLEMQLKYANTRIGELEKKCGSNVSLYILEEKLNNMFRELGNHIDSNRNELQSIHQTIGELSVKANTINVEVWKPKMNQEYWIITSSLYVMSVVNLEYQVDIERINSGNCFRTKELAEQALERVKRAINGDL